MSRKSRTPKPSRRSKASAKLRELLTQPTILDASPKAPDGKRTYADLVHALRNTAHIFGKDAAHAALVKHSDGAKSVRGLDPKYFDAIVEACNKMFTDRGGAPLDFPTATTPDRFDPYGKPYLPTDYNERKGLPIVTGFLDYFPLACLEVAKVSAAGNAQHNPGEPLHWARGKSMDQVNTAVRHLMERGMKDTDGQYHVAKAIWRLLAGLQIQLEQERGLPPSRGCTADQRDDG